jgi:hypothetical protein
MEPIFATLIRNNHFRKSPYIQVINGKRGGFIDLPKEAFL